MKIEKAESELFEKDSDDIDKCKNTFHNEMSELL